MGLDLKEVVFHLLLVTWWTNMFKFVCKSLVQNFSNDHPVRVKLFYVGRWTCQTIKCYV